MSVGVNIGMGWHGVESGLTGMNGGPCRLGGLPDGEPRAELPSGTL